MNEVTIFNIQHLAPVRTVTIDGERWYVAKDVCDALGFTASKGTGTRLLKALDDSTKRYVSRSNLTADAVNFPNRGAYVINEAGLYRLTFRSNRPAARAFTDWVCKVVLPAIRRDGFYIAGEEQHAESNLTDDEFFEKALNIVQAKVARLTAERAAREALVV